MAYCTVENIQAYYMGVTFEAGNDNLNTAELTVFINEATAQIDIALRDTYILPITDTNDLLVLQNICEKLVVCKVDDVFKHERGDKEKVYRNVCKDANKMLQKLKDGDISLFTEVDELDYCGGTEQPDDGCLSCSGCNTETDCGC